MMLFFVGVVFGIILTLVGAIIAAVSEDAKKLKQTKQELKAKIEVQDKVKPKLERIAEITEEQLQIKANSEMPSKNASHSRYKNGLISRFKALDEEKTKLLTDIVELGYDPMITTVDELGIEHTIKLSEHLASMGIMVGKGEQKPEPKKERPKFHVVRNEDDGTSN